jgi:very-short-patch-repair endonuclease
MAKRIPISIRKLAETENVRRIGNYTREEYLIQIVEKQNSWEISKIFDREELLTLRNDINDILGLKSASEKLNCSIEEVEKLQKYHKQNKICDNCKYKFIECMTCINVCQSPLEQTLFLALRNENINAELQKRINRNGETFQNIIPIDKSNILTIPDFYIESNGKRITIYADGHTYHERTENQALRDRNIDRELQNLGFVVLRFTGKEIREKMETVIEIIKKNI